jgi:hypothetical protein
MRDAEGRHGDRYAPKLSSTLGLEDVVFGCTCTISGSSASSPYSSPLLMIYARPRASHLATCCIRTRSTNISSRGINLSIPVSNQRNYSRSSQIERFRLGFRQRIPPIRTTGSFRNCSYQRTKMCRGNAETESGSMVTKAREVLPTNVKPMHYDLTLEPDFKKFTFEGKVVIE